MLTRVLTRADARWRGAQVGALDSIVLALRTHRGEAAVQQQGTRLLYDLVFRSGSMLTAWEKCASITGGQGELFLAMQARGLCISYV